MKRLKRDEASALFMATCAIAIIPTMIFIARPCPLAAESVGQFASVIRDRREDEVLTVMCQEFQGVSRTKVDIDEPLPGTQREARWRKIADALNNRGVEAEKTDAIVRAGKAGLPQEWPCFAERGYLQGRPVWLVVGSLSRGGGEPAWIDQPSRKDIHDDLVDRFCSKVRVIVVDDAAPYAVVQ